MDCFYQANQRIRPSSYFNSPPIMYGYGVPTYYSPPFFPLGRNSEVHRPPVPPLRVPNPVTTSESSTSPVSTVSQTPPASPSESSTETHETTELSDEPNQSGKDASESEDKTGERKQDLFIKNACAELNMAKLN